MQFSRDYCARDLLQSQYQRDLGKLLFPQQRGALCFASQEANRLYSQNATLNTNLPPEQRLALFIKNFIHNLLDDRHLDLHSKLIAREITDPTK